MIVGIGTDIVSIERIAGVLERHGERFVNRVLTPPTCGCCSRSMSSGVSESPATSTITGPRRTGQPSRTTNATAMPAKAIASASPINANSRLAPACAPSPPSACAPATAGLSQ